MRLSAARVTLAIALTAMAAAGLVGAHSGAQMLARPVIGTAAAPAQAAVAGLPGLHGLHAHQRVTAVDVLPATATLLAMLLLVVVVVRRSRPLRCLAPSAAHARGPPAAR